MTACNKTIFHRRVAASCVRPFGHLGSCSDRRIGQTEHRVMVGCINWNQPAPAPIHPFTTRRRRPMNGKWSIHVLGPDDMLDATDRLDAYRQAQEMNANMIAHLEQRAAKGNPATEFAPIVWAVPVQEYDVTEGAAPADARPEGDDRG